MSDESLNLFFPATLEVAKESEHDLDLFCQPMKNQSTVLEFNVQDTSPYLIDLSKTLLEVQIKVLQKDDTKLTANDNVCIVPNGLHSLFKQIDLTISHQNISNSVGSNYSYKSYIDDIFFKDKSFKESLGQCYGLCEDVNLDSATTIDDVTIDSLEKNYGRNNRFVMLKESKPFRLVGHLNLDFFRQPRYLINGCSLGLKFTPNDDQFRLLVGLGKDQTTGGIISI
jgi:hypothetical protein